jgi:hypothetical protein
MTNLVDEYFAVLEKVGVDDFWHPELEALRQRMTRTCPTISVGGAPSKPGAASSHRKPGSKAPSETDHTNS